MKKIYLIIVIIFVAMNCFGQNRNYRDFIVQEGSTWSYSIIENYDTDFYKVNLSHNIGSRLYFSEQDIEVNKMIFNICAYSFFRIDLKDNSLVQYEYYKAPHSGTIHYGSDFFEMDEVIHLQNYVIKNQDTLEKEFGFLIKRIYIENEEVFEAFSHTILNHIKIEIVDENVKKEAKPQKYRVVIAVEYPSWEEEAEMRHKQNLEKIEQEKQRKQEEKALRMQSLIL